MFPWSLLTFNVASYLLAVCIYFQGITSSSAFFIFVFFCLFSNQFVGYVLDTNNLSIIMLQVFFPRLSFDSIVFSPF